jgi:hypothetical protein
MLVDDEWSGKGVAELCLRSWLAYITMSEIGTMYWIITYPWLYLVRKALQLILLGGCRAHPVQIELLRKLIFEFS